MVGTKAGWYKPSRTRPKADPPGRQKVPGGYGGRVYSPKPKTAAPPKSGGTGHWNERKRGPRPNRTVPGVPGYDESYGPAPVPKDVPERTPRPLTRQAQRPAFGRKVPKLRIPGLGSPFIDAFDNLIRENFPARNPSPYMAPKGWCVSAVCNSGPPQYWGGNIRRSTIGRGGYNCTVNIDCISGQAISGTSLPWGVPHPITTTGPEFGLWWGYWAGGGDTARFKHHKSFYRPGPYTGPVEVPFRPTTWTPGIESPPDPNVQRYAPPELNGTPAFVPGVGTPVVDPTRFANPELPYEPDRQWSYQIGTGPAFNVPSRLDPEAPTSPAPLPPVTRSPPQKGEKQGKVVTKTAKIGKALYSALDAASETAEVVDAVYEALPDDVRKRWEKAMFPGARWIKDKQTGKWVKVGVDRPGDNFGQYGLGGADWKLRALYYNWHRVDLEQAVKNIIKNELQDRIIGGMQAGLPNNTGAAHSQGERQVAKLLDQWFEEEFGL